MSKGMFGGFGDGFRDPFKDDPFFGGGMGDMFGGIEKMRKGRKSNMMDMESMPKGGQGSQFYCQSFS